MLQDDVDPTLVINTFLKASAWEAHKQVYPQLDSVRQTAISHIKQRNTVDELLKSAAAFLDNDSLQVSARVNDVKCKLCSSAGIIYSLQCCGSRAYKYSWSA